MKHQITLLRLEADKAIKAVSELRPGREISLVKTNLERTKMWLGKILWEIGNYNPYPQSENPASQSIEPQADQAEEPLFNGTEDFNLISKVKFFRSFLSNLVGAIRSVSDQYEGMPKYRQMYLDAAFLAADEAKMWLGMELHRISLEEAIPHEYPLTPEECIKDGEVTEDLNGTDLTLVDPVKEESPAPEEVQKPMSDDPQL